MTPLSLVEETRRRYDPSVALFYKIQHWTSPDESRVEVQPERFIPVSSLILPVIDRVETAVKRELPRWDVCRRGEREPINYAVRIAVGRRDNFTCRRCHVGIEDKEFELDHVIPWSAGGSDRTDNLRLLCAPCNQERSNFIDGTEERTPMRATWWCVECWTSGQYYERAWSIGTKPVIDLLSRTPFVDDPHVQAFCAECRHISWTDMTL